MIELYNQYNEYKKPNNKILDINQYSIQIEHFEDECSICYIEYNKDDNIRKLLVCDHKYHMECINKWITEYNNHTCPLCRSNILKN